jgi:hypothetical protein
MQRDRSGAMRFSGIRSAPRPDGVRDPEILKTAPNSDSWYYTVVGPGRDSIGFTYYIQ